MSNHQQHFFPPFFDLTSQLNREVMIKSQVLSHYAIAGNGSITFQPERSDWIFSAIIRYGRNNNHRHLHHQTKNQPPLITFRGVTQHVNYSHIPFGDGQSDLSESHLVLDFQVGKDVGLGLFGTDGTSVVSGGVRIAQFSSASNVTLRAHPIAGWGPEIVSPKYHWHNPYWMSNTALVLTKHRSEGVGPSLSWKASVPFAGNASDQELTLDWGVNAALLFGRQRTHVHHQTTGYSYSAKGGPLARKLYTSHYTHTPPDQNRSRSVTIPNIGGFAGISFRYADAKIGFGYRVDWFFNAVDGGIDATKKEDRGFYGPYASISIGFP